MTEDREHGGKVTIVSRRFEWVPLLILLAMWGISAWAWQRVGDRMPVHWGPDGQPDRFGSRAEGLLVVPAIATGIYALLLVLPLIDPGRQAYSLFRGAYLVIRACVLGVLLLVHSAAVLVALGYPLDMTRWVLATLGVMFIVLGNLMGKIRPNFFVGIRTPWTLTSKRSWVKTHRLGGWAFILSGVLFLVAAWISGTEALIGSLILTGVLLVSVVVYSYFAWRSDPDRRSLFSRVQEDVPPQEH